LEVIIHNLEIAEFVSDKNILNNPQDILGLIVIAGEKDVSKVILHENNINPAFFKLKTGFAGETLQKAVNYHLKLAIVGNFRKYSSKSLKSLIYECNNSNQFFLFLI